LNPRPATRDGAAMRIGTFVDHGGANDETERVTGTSAVHS
jgi:hypothetical protein